MSINNNAGVVTNGLVLYYDANNVKSYVGPPLQNLLTQITPAGIGVNTGYVATTGSETVNIPTLGDTFVNYVTIQNNYTAFTPNSADCCPRLFNYGTGTLLPSTLYTYAIVYKCESGYTHPNFMYQYDYNGATYVTEFGLHSTGQRTHLGGGWYWAWATFTTGATVNTLQSTGCFYYQYSTGVDKLTVAKAMMVKGDYTGLHPRYWPALNTTRSTSQSVVDLMGNTTLTATGLTYASDGTFSFGGTAPNVINNTSSTLFNRVNGDSMSVIAWIKPGRNAGQYQVITANRSDSTYNWMLYQHTTDGSIQLHGAAQNKSSYIPTLNTWVCIIATVDSAGNSLLYANGVLQQTVTGYTYNSATPSNFSIGMFGTASEPYLGSIGAVKVYNRALSAAEVNQNFNALRGRYGI